MLFAADHDQDAFYEGKEIEFEIDSDRIFTYSAYDEPTYQRDVCILKLRADESFGIDKYSDVDYACLPEPNQEIEAGTKCWTAGWGTTSSGGEVSQMLQEVDVDIFSDD